MPYLRDYVSPREVGVVLEHVFFHRVSHHVLEPPLQVSLESFTVTFEHEALVPISHSPGEFLGDLNPRLTVNGLALGASGRLDRVAGHVKATLLVVADRSLAIPSPTHRHLPSSTPEARRAMRHAIWILEGSDISML